MLGAEILQVVPPGHLQMHGPLVALSPALLASAAGLSSWISPAWRRGIAATGCVAAWLLLAVALLPGGAASAYQHPVANGWLALDQLAISCALITSVGTAYWARRLQPWWWAQVIALSLIVPLVCAGMAHA